MKYLLAPTKNKEGKGPLDFCWTKPFEPLIFGIKCTHGTPYDSCGCSRAMIGAYTAKATTVGVVAATDLNSDEIAELRVKSFIGHEFNKVNNKEWIKRMTAQVKEDVKFVEDMVKEYPIGTRLGFTFGETTNIFKCLLDGDYGV